MIRAFLRSKEGKFALAILAGLVAVVLLGPYFFSHKANEVQFDSANLSPSGDHLFGTDALGRDRLARLVVASRLSIVLALEATLIGAGIGMIWGAATAQLRGRIQVVGLRLIDALDAFPGLLVAIFVGAINGPGSRSATIGVAVGLSFAFARISANLALSLTSREYVHAARLLGIRSPRIVLRHILPNAGETLAITATVAMSTSIVSLATLSFLGLGVQSPQYDWGSLLTQGVQDIYSAPMAAVGPALAIMVVALAFGFLGEAIARSMNPSRWRAGSTSRSATEPERDSESTRVADRVETVTDVDERERMVVPVGASARGGDTSSSIPVASSTIGDRSAHGAATARASTPGILEVRGLRVSFPEPDSGPLDLVKDISFAVGNGEMVGIAGESGSGKTMTAMAIAGLIPHPGRVGGSIKLDGIDLLAVPDQERRQALVDNVAVVFQDPMSSLNPALTVGRQMTEVVEYHRGMSHKEALEMAADRLDELKIPTPKLQLSRFPYELSGGMRQRVMIAMGLMKTPKLLIADEPTTSLDLTIQSQLMELLHQINEAHEMAVLLISHNLGLLSQNCSKVLTMYAGSIVEDGSAREVMTRPRHPYTRDLLSATPSIESSRTSRLVSIPGQPPDFGAMPSGCAYHPRCPIAIDQCLTQVPPLEVDANGHRVACWVENSEGGI